MTFTVPKGMPRESLAFGLELGLTWCAHGVYMTYCGSKELMDVPIQIFVWLLIS